MKKHFHIFILFLCLGVFLIPKQSFAMQSTEVEHCCKEDNKKDCCKTKDHQKKTNHDDCKDNCCNMCHSCCSTVVFSNEMKNNAFKQFFSGHFQKPNFNYSDPYHSSYLKEIWQPPKIA